MNLEIWHRQSCIQFKLRTSLNDSRLEFGNFVGAVGVKLLKFCSTATRLQCRSATCAALPSLARCKNRPCEHYLQMAMLLSNKTLSIECYSETSINCVFMFCCYFVCIAYSCLVVFYIINSMFFLTCCMCVCHMCIKKYLLTYLTSKEVYETSHSRLSRDGSVTAIPIRRSFRRAS